MRNLGRKVAWGDTMHCGKAVRLAWEQEEQSHTVVVTGKWSQQHFMYLSLAPRTVDSMSASSGLATTSTHASKIGQN